MKKLLTLVLFPVAAAVIAVAQRSMPPEPIPPTGQHIVCQGPVVTAFEAPQAIENLRAQGCSHIELDHLADGYYLMHGEKTLVQNP